MEKKITKKEAAERLENLVLQLDIVEKNDSTAIPKYMTIFSYTQDGDMVTEGRCHNCGYKGFVQHETDSWRRRSKPTMCPQCGNVHVTANYHTSPVPNDSRVIIQEEDNGFNFLVYETIYSFLGDRDDGAELQPEDWVENEPVKEFRVRAAGLFDNNAGMFIYDKYSNHHYTTTNQCLGTAAYGSFQKQAALTHPHLLQRFKDLLDKKAVESEKRRLSSKKHLLDEMRYNYKPKAVNMDDVKNTGASILAYLDSDKGGKRIYCASCTRCGDSWLVAEENIENDTYVCPNCGLEHKQRYSYSYYRGTSTEEMNVVKFESTNLPENDLLIRVFYVCHKLENKVITTEAVEAQRIFAGKQLIVYSNENCNRYGSIKPGPDKFEKVTIRDIEVGMNHWRSKQERVLSTEDEMRDAIRNSCLMYSGLVEAYGLGDSRYRAYAAAPDLQYLRAWYKNPGVELILKSNMIKFLNDAINDPSKMSTGKKLAEVLGVSTAVAKVAAKNDFSYSELIDFNALYEQDNSFTMEMYEAIKNERVAIHSIISLKRTYNIAYANTLRYLQNTYDHQCIEKREALSLWTDYLNMATALHMDLSDNSKKYPASLKKEHDIAMFAHRSIQIELDKEEFARQAKKNEFYEYSYKDLVAIVPKTPQDVVEEATRQRNCLRTYVDRIKRGDTVVVFIRYKTTPENTLYTAEVCNGSLLQLKGYQNSNPRNRMLNEFIAHWSKAKAIKVNC